MLMFEKSAIINHKMERLSQGKSIDIPQKIVYLLVHWGFILLISAIKENQSNCYLAKLISALPVLTGER